MKQFDVLNLGTVVLDIPVKLPYKVLDFKTDLTRLKELKLIPGGDAANSSIVLSQLGMRVSLIAAVGEDAFGGIFKQLLIRSGVDVTFVAEKPGVNTSVSLVMINADGDRCFLSARGNNDTLCASDFGDVLFDSGARHLNYSGFFLHPQLDRGGLTDIFRKAKEKGMSISADANSDIYGLGIKTIKPHLEYVDMFMPSYGEAQQLTGETDPKRMASYLADQIGDKIFIIKLGEDGCYLFQHGKGTVIPAFKVDPVDTTGAGDNFVAGVIFAHLSGMDMPDCVRYGSAVAAMNIQYIGATNPAVTREAVEAFLKAH